MKSTTLETYTELINWLLLQCLKLKRGIKMEFFKTGVVAKIVITEAKTISIVRAV